MAGSRAGTKSGSAGGRTLRQEAKELQKRAPFTIDSPFNLTLGMYESEETAQQIIRRSIEHMDPGARQLCIRPTTFEEALNSARMSRERRAVLESYQ